jgi:hypothetical protein
MLTQYAKNCTPPEPWLPTGWTLHKCEASGKTMFMHSFSNDITLDRNKVYKYFSIKYVNSGVGNKASCNDDEDNDVDDAITQVQA